MSFCKLGLNKQSENDIESVNQSKVESPLNSECIDKEGVCFFLRSKLPTAVGTVNGRKVDILRDTGCTTVTSNIGVPWAPMTSQNGGQDGRHDPKMAAMAPRWPPRPPVTRWRVRGASPCPRSR